MDTYSKNLLVSKIKGLTQQIKRVKRQIVDGAPKDDGTPEQMRGWYLTHHAKHWMQLPSVKHRLGEEARYHNLAYSFLRGVPYKVVENKCAETNKPEAHCLLFTLNNFGCYQTRRTATPEDVMKWLGIEKEKPTEKEIAALTVEKPTRTVKSLPTHSFLDKVMQWLNR